MSLPPLPLPLPPSDALTLTGPCAMYFNAYAHNLAIKKHQERTTKIQPVPVVPRLFLSAYHIFQFIHLHMYIYVYTRRR